MIRIYDQWTWKLPSSSTWLRNRGKEISGSKGAEKKERIMKNPKDRSPVTKREHTCLTSKGASLWAE